VTDGTIEAVVFDLGGVLIDWNPRYLYRQLFGDHAEMERFLAEVCNDAWHRQHDLGADIGESCVRRAAEFPAYREMIMAWADRGEEMAAGQIDETVEVLTALKAAGMPCYALSNMEPEPFAIRYDRFGFMKLFDGMVISGHEGVAKPDPAIFLILLERYGLAPGTSVFIDDAERNTVAARGVGMRALRFASPGQLREDLRRLGVPGLDGE
jgi:2-haloacid dehalogenase